MSIVSAFAGRYGALDYAYGIAGRSATGGPGGPSLQIGTGNSAVGVGTITVITSATETQGGSNQIPVSAGSNTTGATPITVGIGANAETVTPTAVSQPSLSGFQPGPQSVTISATFANLHGPQEPVTSGTYGLQEAINTASANGGGLVVITPAWYSAGGTTAIVTAAVLPSNGTVQIEDLMTGGTWSLGGNSLTVLAAPSAATSATVASLTTVGTWTAVTEHVLFTYVNAIGGETLASADYSFTATVSVAIGGTGPAALAGAVGYRVYIGTNATTSCYMVPVTAANSLSGSAGVLQCGPIAAFKIGTSFSVATATTNAGGNPPLVQSTAFGAAVPINYNADFMAQSFQTILGPFTATSTVTAGTAIEWGHVQLPTAFLNVLNRTVRLTLHGYYTPVSTATLIITVAIASVYGVTTTTVFTVTTPASSGTTAANINGYIDIKTAAIGATGTVECHGILVYGGATGTAGLLVSAGDSVQAASSAIDLTKQDTIVISINSGTANLTTSQLRSLTVEVLQ